MLEWSDYINKILASKSKFDGVSLSLGDGNSIVGIPPIIKASVLMLDKMLENQGKFNILVFPERVQSIFIFTLTKLLHNIDQGKIDKSYNPENFMPGERLKFKNTVVEFLGVETIGDKQMMKIRLADLEDTAPIDFFPLFQRTSTKRRLSKYAQYAKAKKEAKKSLNQMTPDEHYIKLLSDYKTHMGSSIVNMTSLVNTKAIIDSCTLCGHDIKDILYIGQTDYEGNVSNIGAGQLDGIPSIILSSDLYGISALANTGHPIQSIIIDGSNANALLSQLDALDELIRLNVPIVCVTDIANSFDLQPFIDRNFNVWRWDKSSITEALYKEHTLTAETKVKLCSKCKLNYLKSDGNEITSAIKILSLHRAESKEQSAGMMGIFDKLNGLSFTALYESMPFGEDKLSRARLSLDDCALALEKEKMYIAPETYSDYSSVIKNLRIIYTHKYKLPKTDIFLTYLKENKFKTVCLIVPDRADTLEIQNYWQMICRRNKILTQVYVLHSGEYYLSQCNQFSSTVVVGWLKRAIMRKILYSYNSENYAVLLYDYESRWKNYATHKWNSALVNDGNRKIIEHSLASDKFEISTKRFEVTSPAAEEVPEEDELNDIELILRENKYRQYITQGGNHNQSEPREAIPVNFVGGYISFFCTGHKIINASDIIMRSSDKIKTVLPAELKMGDFVVMREANRDLIKEMADIILNNSGKSTARELSGKWREALEIERLFNTDEQIYERLKEAGCKKEYPTVRGWLQDDDVIAPQSFEDLQYIAKITESAVLTELLDQVFSAAQIVRTAHTQAGRVLSMQLKTKIVEVLKNSDDIDPFNIWEPIETEVEGIGTVRILKIIDIGSPVMVDAADVNRLITE